MKKQYQVKARYRDTDKAGSQYFANALNIVHDVLEDLVEDLEIGWNRWFEAADGWSAPVRHVEVDYLLPIDPPSTLLVDVYCTKLGKSSVALQFDLFQKEQVAAKIKVVHVFVGTDGNKVDVPEIVKRAFKE